MEDIVAEHLENIASQLKERLRDPEEVESVWPEEPDKIIVTTKDGREEIFQVTECKIVTTTSVNVTTPDNRIIHFSFQ